MRRAALRHIDSSSKSDLAQCAIVTPLSARSDLISEEPKNRAQGREQDAKRANHEPPAQITADADELVDIQAPPNEANHAKGDPGHDEHVGRT